MKLKNRKTAFSLIEISVVILIIGLIVAGIVQGSRMITKSKLVSARSLTNASPVLVIPGLKLWLDATAVNAFSLSNPSTDDLLPLWQETNKPSTEIITATASTSKPYYDEKGIGGLPSVRFSNNRYFDLPDSTLPTGNAFTLFIVYSGTASGNLLGTGGNKFNNGQIFDITNSCTCFGGASSGVGTNYNLPTLASDNKVLGLSYNSSKLLTLYINGYTDTTTNYQHTLPVDMTNLTTYHRIGYATSMPSAYNNPHLVGEIGEIILFDRELAPDEISDINQYLIKKWKIKAL